MKFTVEKNLLQAAIATASRASAVKSAIPALEGLLIVASGNTVKISAYDLKTGIITTVPVDVIGEGSIVLNAKLFVEIIRKLPDDIISISADENYLTKIECSMCEFQIIGSSAADYPDLPAIDYQKSFSLTQKNLKSMIALTNFSVSDNESRPILTGSLFEVDKTQLTIVACDGFRISLRREQITKSDGSSLSFVVPGSALSEAEKILADSDTPVSIMLGSKHIIFSISGTFLISRRLEGDFLNYKTSIQQAEKYSIEADRQALVNALDRVSLIISDKLKSPVRCTVNDGVLNLLSSSALGRASDSCTIKGNGEGLEIGFNNRYLLEALRAAPAEHIRINLISGTAPCIIIPADGSNNFLYLVLPMRLGAYES